MPKKLIANARKALPNKASNVQKKLLSALGSYIPSDEVSHFDDDIFSDIAQTHWELAKRRKKEGSQVRIYCPMAKSRRMRKTIIDVVSRDMAFLVDSVVAEINRHNLLIDFLIHPVFYVQHDNKGNLLDLSTTKRKDYTKQSHIHIHIKETIPEKVLEKLGQGLEEVLDDVYHANRDWKAMLAQLRDARDELANATVKGRKGGCERYCAFLDYLCDNNFTLLGYREYEFSGDKKEVKSRTVRGSSLGLLHGDVKPAYVNESKEGLPRNLQELRKKLDPVSVSKTNRVSTVHRRVPMDAIAIKTYDEKGNVKGEKLFLGLFTSVTYSRSVSDVPLLREKVDEIVSMSDFAPASHDQKTLRHILEKYPRDELFQIRTDTLYRTALDILRLQERQRIALFMRRDDFRRYISCLVYIPRDRFGTYLRKEIGKILEAEVNGTVSSFKTSLDDSLFARVMFILKVDQNDTPKYDQKEIEKKLQIAGQTWAERLNYALDEKDLEQSEITRLTLKYGEAFSISYTSTFTAKQAIYDIEKIETVLQTNELDLDLYRTDDIEANHIRLKVYHPEKPLTLSDVLPILEHMGLRAISELPFEIKPADEDKVVWVHDFLLERPSGKSADLVSEIKDKFEESFKRVWYNKIDSDALNKLVIRGQMDWQEIMILRSYVRYLKQLKYPFGRLYVENAVTSNPKISKLLVEYFKERHDPQIAGDGEKILGKLERALEKVESLDQDRILRSILCVVKATLRTNFYLHKPYLSLKLDCKKIYDMPEPKPFREIFVYSPRVEAVHLRGDKIARGGLRWSDRHEDFRTEVLGLMKAQMVKNSVIVPMGSKGGFVVKTKTNSREEFTAEGIECYKTFIRGLLDITDNQKGGEIIPPKNVVRLDGDDPYLVVAADKGTATFSDIANGISQEYGFWLDDAFASGGSAGYDHKKMGITARGGWESVKAHFRELNHDTQTQRFDVIGVGDMGGDVFGNGMLLSEQIALVGAFNHLHIFCDPDPDLEKSFKERKRLFEAVKGWDSYDESKLSKGGKIFSRSEKVLKLTPEIQERFGLESNKVSPPELMRAMLGARTDLIWFGGIGTYIKSKDETHAQVGDKANDGIRLNAEDVRAKVIGEGANLGVTQLGRIEFAKQGGRINTDFIDNSGGVDSSDHEVNIKILLSDVMRSKGNSMDLEARNKLLVKMTDDIAQHVLWHNYQQAQAISLARLQASQNLKEHEALIQHLERKTGLSRKLEGLPDAEEIEALMRNGKGLTRPELCVLLSYAKIEFTKEILASSVPDDPYMQSWLFKYFPEILRKKYKTYIERHQLKREIIATAIANSIVNRMGPTFLQGVVKRTAASCSQVASAYMVVREVFGLFDLWSEIEKLDNKVPAMVQLRAMRSISDLAEFNITWFLTRLGRDLNPTEDIKAFGHCIALLRKNIKKLLTPELKVMVKQHTESGKRDGLTNKLAEEVALLPVLSSACDIIRISLEQRTDLLETAQTYFEVGEEFSLDWLRNQARFMNTDSKWSAEAAEGIIDQLYGAQAGLTVRILRDSARVDQGTKKGKAKKAEISLVKPWVEKHQGLYQQVVPLFEEMRRSGSVDLSMLIIAEQRLRSLYGG